ncbi:hypothetical protein [Chryseobacterium sp. PMSZPI]|uniref:hypothetical protein n=1 Tax=Chryseobacterium sp. PMSZPI TaxID=1033900 RepID=UPI00105631E0|nr:hypothetical protein [Chryseobacterium sp. PMSZPI]
MKKKVMIALALLSLPLIIISCKKEEKTTTPATTNVSSDAVKATKPVDEIDYKNFNIFDVTTISSGQNNELADVFISVSDINNNPNVISSDFLKKQKQMFFEQLKYLELDAEHRNKLLSGIHLTENDSLYLFNYELNKLQKTPISKLKAVAYLDVYASEGEDIDAGSYMVGFQIESKKKIADYDQFHNAIAYFGNKNPFVENKMKPIKWEKSGPDISKKYFAGSKLTYGQTFQSKYENLTYYLQELLEDEMVLERRLIVINDHHQKIFETTYTTAGSDGAEFYPLNGDNKDNPNNFQWTGYLFKGKPPVTFGFIAPSFGCPSILFLDKKEKPLKINCDNRH